MAAGSTRARGNHDINDELERRGVMIRRFDYTHSLPHCCAAERC